MGGRGRDVPGWWGSSSGRSYFEAFGGSSTGGGGGGGGSSDEERRAAWISSQPSRSVTVPEDDPHRMRKEYQIRQCGNTEYQVRGAGARAVWADGFRASDGYLLEAKHVGNPGTSPYIPGSTVFSLARENALAESEAEIVRYAATIRDPDTPVEGLEVVVNDGRAVSLFEEMMARYDCPGRVALRR